MTIPGMVAISTCRGCVVEGDNYSGFNACHYTGDDMAHVEGCRKELCKELGINRESLIMPRQTHSVNVKVITSLPINEGEIENVDAIVTTLHHVAIAINTADCVPIVLVDDVAHVIAVVHSGWKGTVKRIVAHTVEKMLECGASLQDIKVAMGPCICGDCFEVGPEVVKEFEENGFNSSQIILRNYEERNHIDLPQACRMTLLEAGVLDENISLSKECSRCNPNKYFSARRLGINSGRTLTVVMQD